MAKTFREWDVDKSVLFPPNAMDLAPGAHVARFLKNRVVEELNLGEILKRYQEERGYPPYHPLMMTTLILYGYCQGIYPSPHSRIQHPNPLAEAR